MFRATTVFVLLLCTPGVCAESKRDLARDGRQLRLVEEALYAAEAEGPGPSRDETREAARQTLERMAAGLPAALRSAEALSSERLALTFLRVTALLQEAGGAVPPPAAVLRVLDWLHQESRLQEIAALRGFLVHSGPWYRNYLTTRSRVLAERLGQLPNPIAVELLGLLLHAVAPAARERVLRAGLAHRDAGLRLHALRSLLPHRWAPASESWPQYAHNEALQAQVAAMWANDPAREIRGLLDDRLAQRQQDPAAPELLRREDLAAEPARRVERSLGSLSVREPRFRLRSLAALAQSPASVASPAFRARVLELLQSDPSEPVRWEAARILFSNREVDPAFLPALLHVVRHDPSREVRRALAGLLDPLGETDPKVRLVLSRAYVQGRLPERNEWHCDGVFRLY